MDRSRGAAGSSPSGGGEGGEGEVLDIKPLRSLAPMLPSLLGSLFSKTPPFFFVSPISFSPFSSPATVSSDGGQHVPPAPEKTTPPYGGLPEKVRGKQPFTAETQAAPPSSAFSFPSAGAGESFQGHPTSRAPEKTPPAGRGKDNRRRKRSVGEETHPVVASSSSPISPPSAAGASLPGQKSSPAGGRRKYTPRRKPLKEETEMMSPSPTSPVISPYASGAASLSGDQPSSTPEKPTPPTGRRRRSRKTPTHDTTLVAVLPSPPEDPTEAVEVLLQTFDAIRRRTIQLDELNGANSRADMKAGAAMARVKLRANVTKRIGSVPGIAVGDVFFFRLEIFLAGLHHQTMAGIDSTTATFDDGATDTVAISVVSSGGTYDDDTDSVDSIVYSGQGGAADQKLEKGNLALERTWRRGNEVRVIRGVKEAGGAAGKIYIYDGLYRVEQYWTEMAKSGFSIFKFNLVRQPGQPAAFAVWKATELWKKEGSAARGASVRSPDLSAGAESFPVVLFNDVDSDPNPKPFLYAASRRCNSASPAPAGGCVCEGVCRPDNKDCACVQRNGGALPYGVGRLLVRRRPVVYECGGSCRCSESCRNRMTQKGGKLHFEVFKTQEKGWGLRSWDAIRCGSFVCELVGDELEEEDEVAEKRDNAEEEDEHLFEGSSWDEAAERWNYGPELVGEAALADEAAGPPVAVALTARRMGNVARFMNHSCSPNLFWQAVVRAGEEEGEEGRRRRRCHVAFFALKHIPPMAELTYDYGAGGPKAKEKKCACGSHECRGFFMQR